MSRKWLCHLPISEDASRPVHAELFPGKELHFRVSQGKILVDWLSILLHWIVTWLLNVFSILLACSSLEFIITKLFPSLSFFVFLVFLVLLGFEIALIEVVKLLNRYSSKPLSKSSDLSCLGPSLASDPKMHRLINVQTELFLSGKLH